MHTPGSHSHAAGGGYDSQWRKHARAPACQVG